MLSKGALLVSEGARLLPLTLHRQIGRHPRCLMIETVMPETRRPKVVVIMPAYNAAKTLRMTYMELPHDVVDVVLLVDDGSSDETVEIARQLNLELFIHNRNYGYGGNQKTCYREALRAGAEIIVMV